LAIAKHIFKESQLMLNTRKSTLQILLFAASFLSSCNKQDSQTPKPVDPTENPSALKEDISVSTDGLELLTNGTGKFYRPGTAYYFATTFVWDIDAQTLAKGKKVFGKYEGAGIEQIKSITKSYDGGYNITLNTDNIRTIFSNDSKIVTREDGKVYAEKITFSDTPYKFITTDAKTAEEAKALFDKFSKMNHEVTITALSENNVMIIASQKYILAK
jgi:hypothetical protein